jgi:SAM-dependent methyltransferase
VNSNPFPLGFFDRADRSRDSGFYSLPRMVTHLDDHAIAAVGALYDELGISGDVLDLMSSWVSHFRNPPAHLTVLGMNSDELAANPSAGVMVVHDLNAEPRSPFPDESFDAVVCCVSVDYLTRPVEVFADVARLLRPGGPFVCAFSNRCFPTKAIRGWLYADDEKRCEIVEQYFRLAGHWDEPRSQRRTPVSHPGDPLLAVWAHRARRAPTDEPRSPAEIDAVLNAAPSTMIGDSASRTQKEESCRRSFGSDAVQEVEVWPPTSALRGRRQTIYCCVG